MPVGVSTIFSELVSRRQKCSGDSLGLGDRSYLRQIDAWSKVTRTPKHQQALLLYQHLSGRAWIESEGLSVEDLPGPEGLQIFRGGLRKGGGSQQDSRIPYHFLPSSSLPAQSDGEGVQLEIRSGTQSAPRDWAQVAGGGSGLGLLELVGTFEFRVLASRERVPTTRLQRAAVLHEKSLRPPWQPKKPFDPKTGKPMAVRGAYLTGIDEDEDGAIRVKRG